MPIPLLIALALGPLAIYFLTLGAWQSGNDPKVVPGAIDFGMLVFGVGGLLAFGPIGNTLIGLLFPSPSLWAHLALPTSLALAALLWSPRTRRRVVVYNVDPASLDQALSRTLDALPGHFRQTLGGFEDETSGLGLRVETYPRGRTGQVEAFGTHAETLAALIAPGLREALRGTGRRTTTVARFWMTLAALVIWIPMIAAILGRSQVRAALRALLERLHGG